MPEVNPVEGWEAWTGSRGTLIMTAHQSRLLREKRNRAREMWEKYCEDYVVVIKYKTTGMFF